MVADPDEKGANQTAVALVLDRSDPALQVQL
jgi:hypothetical protein